MVMVKLSHAYSSPTCREFENQFLRTLGHPGYYNPGMNTRRTGSPVFTLAGLLFHLISFLRSPGPDSYPLARDGGGSRCRGHGPTYNVGACDELGVLTGFADSTGD